MRPLDESIDFAGVGRKRGEEGRRSQGGGVRERDGHAGAQKKAMPHACGCQAYLRDLEVEILPAVVVAHACPGRLPLPSQRCQQHHGAPSETAHPVKDISSLVLPL